VTRRAWLIALLAAIVSACGRKGSLEPPDGADPNAPRDYPRR
jgi:predicted small lipoprotein YifL